MDYLTGSETESIIVYYILHVVWMFKWLKVKNEQMSLWFCNQQQFAWVHTDVQSDAAPHLCDPRITFNVMNLTAIQKNHHTTSITNHRESV